LQIFLRKRSKPWATKKMPVACGGALREPRLLAAVHRQPPHQNPAAHGRQPNCPERISELHQPYFFLVFLFFPPVFFFEPDFWESDLFLPPDFLAADFFLELLDWLTELDGLSEPPDWAAELDGLSEPPDWAAELDLFLLPLFLRGFSTAGLSVLLGGAPPPPTCCVGGAGFTKEGRIERESTALPVPPALVAVIETLKFPDALGVPLIIPLVAFSVRPGGSPVTP
jgi:hypothetical protein